MRSADASHFALTVPELKTGHVFLTRSQDPSQHGKTQQCQAEEYHEKDHLPLLECGAAPLLQFANQPVRKQVDHDRIKRE